MRKPSLKTLKNQLTGVHAVYCKLFYRKCVTCGATQSLQCAHLFSRVALATRWDMPHDEASNCACQCASCNLKHEHNSYAYTNWFIEKYGKTAWDELNWRWHSVFQPHRQWLEDAILACETSIVMLLEAMHMKEVPKCYGTLPPKSARAVSESLKQLDRQGSSRMRGSSPPPTPSPTSTGP